MEPTSRDSKDFARLQEEHAKALRASQKATQQWEQFKYDYEVLQARLHTLPDRLTHDVMVPFGRFGFMPGQLYHTNEVLVLLGDNWFARRSAKQAIEIAERRKQYVCEMLEKERKQLQDWEARHAFVDEFSATVEEHGDTVEIREEYNPAEEERRRRARKKERERRGVGTVVPPPRPAFPRGAAPKTGGGGGGGGGGRDWGGGRRRDGDGGRGEGGLSEEELWAKLEREEEEQEKEEVRRQDQEAREGKGREERREDEDMKAVSGAVISRGPPTITFVHSTPSTTASSIDQDSENREKPLFLSPADIGPQRPVTEQSITGTRGGEGEEVPESKAVHWDPNLVSYSGEKLTEPPALPTVVDPVPFSGQVMEREVSTVPTHQAPPPRKVSKFKSSRSSK